MHLYIYVVCLVLIKPQYSLNSHSLSPINILFLQKIKIGGKQTSDNLNTVQEKTAANIFHAPKNSQK